MTWQTVGASVIGSSHIKTGKPCQDSHGFQALSDDILLIAVADGLGSAEKSEAGSRLAVDTALASLAGALDGDGASSLEAWQPALESAFAAARTALEERADADSLALRDLGTTLICVVLAPGWAACGQVGDGAVVARQMDDSLSLLSAPQRGEYANETVPLTTRNALEMVRYSNHQIEIKALAVLSDGLQNLALQGLEYLPFGQFFNPFFDIVGRSTGLEQTRVQIEEFLGSERVCGRTDDDKTLVLTSRLQPAADEPSAANEMSASDETSKA